MSARRKSLRFAAQALALASGLLALLATRAAGAAPLRVAVLGPPDSSLLARVARNLRAMKHEVAPATTALCSRDVVTRLLEELPADAAICFDGDALSAWTKREAAVALEEAFPRGKVDGRVEELDAARIVLALDRAGSAEAPNAAPPRSRSLTIVANESDARDETIVTTPPPAPEPTAKDTGPTRPPPPTPPRSAPRALVGLGPAVLTSQGEPAFGISADAEIGFTRGVAAVPWLMFAPTALTAERSEGSASYRPTLFGFGFLFSLLPQSAVVVPRLGAGYSMVWLHVTPETAQAPNVTRGSEDLLAPAMYLTAAGSVRISRSFRIVAEAVGMAATHEMVIRISGNTAARWGGAVGALAIRGEWVIAP